MKSYSVGALCFLAGVSLGILVLAPTVRLVPTLTARVKELEKQVTTLTKSESIPANTGPTCESSPRFWAEANRSSQQDLGGVIAVPEKTVKGCLER